MGQRKKRPVGPLAGTSDGIDFNEYGIPVDYDSNRARYGPLLQRCPHCGRAKPEWAFTAFAWGSRGQYCRTCRIEDSRKRRILREMSERGHV